jgi:putative aldouronate transport system substrate-binding protein
MKFMKKPSLFTLIAILVLVSVLAGCSGGNKEAANSSSAATETGSSASSEAPTDSGYQLGQEPLEYTMYGNYDWYTMPQWGDDLATKWIQENKKVNVVPVNSGGNAKQKLNTMIASGELPDVIWMDRGPDVERLREADLLVPLDDYLDKYPNLKKWAGEAALNMLRSPDGKIYQFPNWYTSQPNGNAGYVVNEKIYKELGSPPLETTDDLYAYLKQIKAKYPDVFPFEPGQEATGGGIDIMYGAFAENHFTGYIGQRGVPNGDKLTSIFTDPAYRESLQFASKLFREKLMSQDVITQTSDQVKEKITTGKFGVYADNSPTNNANLGHSLLKAKDPAEGFKMIWPIHKPGLDKNKIFTGNYSQLGWNVSVITKSAKDPEAIFAFLDWLTGPEGERVIFWGPEGLYWEGTDADEAPIFTDAYVTDVENRDKLMALTNNFQWVGNTVYIDKSKSKFELTLPPEKQNWATRYQSEITWKTQANGTEFVNLDPMPDSEEGIIGQRVNDIYLEARAKAIFAKSDEEVLAVLDKAEKDAQDAGYSKLLEFKTQRWQENVKRIKGE